MIGNVTSSAILSLRHHCNTDPWLPTISTWPIFANNFRSPHTFSWYSTCFQKSSTFLDSTSYETWADCVMAIFHWQYDLFIRSCILLSIVWIKWNNVCDNVMLVLESSHWTCPYPCLTTLLHPLTPDTSWWVRAGRLALTSPLTMSVSCSCWSSLPPVAAVIYAWRRCPTTWSGWPRSRRKAAWTWTLRPNAEGWQGIRNTDLIG